MEEGTEVVLLEIGMFGLRFGLLSALIMEDIAVRKQTTHTIQ